MTKKKGGGGKAEKTLTCPKFIDKVRATALRTLKSQIATDKATLHEACKDGLSRSLKELQEAGCGQERNKKVLTVLMGNHQHFYEFCKVDDKVNVPGSSAGITTRVTKGVMRVSSQYIIDKG